MKTVFITGVSKGIGASLADLFVQNNCRVIGTSRTGEGVNAKVEMLQLDLSDLQSVQHAVTEWKKKGVKIDILVNNAAVGYDLPLDLPEVESFKQTFDVNVTGTVFFTELMLDTINENGKLINVSSKMGSIAMCSGTDAVAYRMSKTALNMYAKIVSNRLKGKQTVATIHPGWVRTTLTADNANAPLSTEESAVSIFKFIESDFKTGVYWNAPEQFEIAW
jgi:NAD(P)-dependent dehydrogenase (short-subunit alcohol dehydrogenase family)